MRRSFNGDESLRELEREALSMELPAMAAFVRAAKRAGLLPTQDLEKMLAAQRPKTGAPTLAMIETVLIELWGAISGKKTEWNPKEADRFAAWTMGFGIHAVRKDKFPDRAAVRLDVRSKRYMPVVLAVIDGNNVTVGAGVIDVDQNSPIPFAVWPIEFGSLEGETEDQFELNYHPAFEGLARPKLTANLLAWSRREDWDRVRMSRTQVVAFLMELELARRGPSELVLAPLSVVDVSELARGVEKLLAQVHRTGLRERRLSSGDIRELLWELLSYEGAIVSTMNGSGGSPPASPPEIQTFVTTKPTEAEGVMAVDTRNRIIIRPREHTGRRRAGSPKADFAIAVRDKNDVTLAITSALIPRHEPFYPWIESYPYVEDLIRFARLEAPGKIRMSVEAARTFAVKPKGTRA